MPSAVAVAAFAVLTAVASASNSDNYFCRPCGLLMERTYKRLVERTTEVQAGMTAGVKEDVEFDIKGMAKAACSGYDFRSTYNEDLGELCREIVDKNSHIVALSFAGKAPTPQTTYNAAVEACVTQMDLCDEPEAPPSSPDDCEVCRAVVQDMQDVLLRGKGKPRHYLKKKHVWGTLDEVCEDIPVRHSSENGWATAMQEMCDELLEMHEEELGDAFLEVGMDYDATHPARIVCGSKGLGVCKARKGQWDGIRSPFVKRPVTDAHEEL